MGEVHGNHEVALSIINEGDPSPTTSASRFCFSVHFLQKMIAEFLGTYFLMFAGCASISADLNKGGVVTLLGVAVVWGSAVMVLVYTLGHVSGAHFNPAVTIALTTCGRFPLKQVPAYLLCQFLGSTLANGTLRLILNGKQEHFLGTAPPGSDMQALAVEFIITFFLLFVVCGVATDNRAITEFAGLVIGVTILLNVVFAAPLSGASMNPARSLGSAIVASYYKGIWIYFVGPISGAISGAWAYNIIRLTDKPLMPDRSGLHQPQQQQQQNIYK